MRALDRMTSILEAVASSRRPINVTEAANASGLAVPTAFRLMRDLAESGLLERTDSGGGYRLGARLIAIARAASERSDLVDVAIPEMVRLRDLTGETVSLHVRGGDNRICIAEIQSREEIRSVVPLGMSLPLYRGLTGEVLLSGLPLSDLEAYLDRLPPEIDREALRDKVLRTRQLGWTMASNTLREGVGGLSGPVYGRDGSIVAALTVGGPTWRLTEPIMQQFGPALLAAITRVSEAYGSAMNGKPAPRVQTGDEAAG